VLWRGVDVNGSIVNDSVKVRVSGAVKYGGPLDSGKKVTTSMQTESTNCSATRKVSLKTWR
jgi:hypothetical protein